MAHFAQVGANSRDTLEAAGLVEPIPGVGRCEAPADYSNRSFSGVEEVRLLDVGEVTLEALRSAVDTSTIGASTIGSNTAEDGVDARAAEDGALDESEPAEAAGESTDVHEQERQDRRLRAAAALPPAPVSLAPYAFPSISGFASGVVYTSRDRSAEALPSGVPYRVAVAGSPDLPGFTIEGTAPSQLRDVTLGGEPLSQVERISASAPLDVTWLVDRSTSTTDPSPGDRHSGGDVLGDIVVVDLANGDDGSVFVRCTFADEIGAGTIPAEWLDGHSGRGRVQLHRRRVLSGTLASPAADGSPFSEPTLDSARIRLSFDLETSVSVHFAD